MAGTGAGFPQTAWTSWGAALGAASPRKEAALNRFVALYWPAVYAFIRRPRESPRTTPRT